MVRVRPLARSILGLLALVCLAAGSLPAQEEAVLPERLAGWERAEWVRVDARELESVAGEEAAILREYGCLSAESAWYGKGAGRWHVTAFRMADRTGAYGAQSLLGGTGPVAALGEAGGRSATRVAYFQGNYFVWAEAAADEAALRALASVLARLPEYVASLPVLESYLPPEGLIRGSQRYLLGPTGLSTVLAAAPGDWVGFAYGAEVQLARYHLGGGEAVFLLISYPTPQIAGERLRAFEQLFNLNGGAGDSREPIYARRQGTYVALVSGIRSAEAAGRLMDQVRYSTQISWSDPKDPREQINWAHTLLNLFVGTGLILLFTLLSGLAYGLIRLGIRRFFPGVVFTRPTEGDMIIFKLDGPPPKV